MEILENSIIDISLLNFYLEENCAATSFSHLICACCFQFFVSTTSAVVMLAHKAVN